MDLTINVEYHGKVYEIWADGVVYNSTDQADIPKLIFNIRDTFVKVAQNENHSQRLTSTSKV